ncbi:hypothetical protein SALBM311S_04731 [Streptomyces alboniger]
MPTARPIINASVEVVSPRSRALARAVMVETPIPTPMIAVSSGSPAATSEPRVTTRTTAAMARPMTSPTAPGSAPAWSASPPTSTVSPVARASSPAVSRASLVESASSMPGSLYFTEV